jgi:hypothetical protein
LSQLGLKAAEMYVKWKDSFKMYSKSLQEIRFSFVYICLLV